MFKTINLHLTDRCNYCCHFCFVHKNNKELTLEEVKKVIYKCKNYFDSNNIKGRINLAGGEPLLYPYIQQTIDYINSLGIEVSIITNGSKLTESFIISNKNKLSMIGISVDSLDSNINKILGRCDHNVTLDKNRLLYLCNLIKSNNIKLKINQCVSKLTLDSNIIDFIEEAKPDRFKLLQVVPDNPFSNKNQITNKEFEDYLKKYDDNNIEYFKEESNLMLTRYLIIDSEGKVSQDNTHTSGLSILGDNEIEDYTKLLH